MEALRLRHKILLLIAGAFFMLGLRAFIAMACCNRGDDFSRFGFYAKAAHQYKKALFLASDYTYAYNRLAYAYVEMRRLDEAKAVWVRSLAYNNANEVAYQELGALHAQQNQYALAEIYFYKALACNPNNRIALVWLETISLIRRKLLETPANQ